MKTKIFAVTFKDGKEIKREFLKNVILDNDRISARVYDKLHSLAYPKNKKIKKREYLKIMTEDGRKTSYCGSNAVSAGIACVLFE